MSTGTIFSAREWWRSGTGVGRHFSEGGQHSRFYIQSSSVADFWSEPVSLEEGGRLGKSDHVILEMEIGVENRREEDEKEYHDWRKADWHQIRRDIREEDWRREMEGKTVDGAWKHLKKMEETVEKNGPKKRRKNKNRPPWLTQEIVRKIRKKKRLWKKARNG